MKELIEAIIYEIEMYHPEDDWEVDWVKDQLRDYKKLLKEINF